MYLESDTTSGNLNVGITKFMSLHVHNNLHIAQRQGFCGTASENQLLLLLPVIQFCVVHFKTLPYTKSYITFLAVHCGAFLDSFPGLAFAFLCTHVT